MVLPDNIAGLFTLGSQIARGVKTAGKGIQNVAKSVGGYYGKKQKAQDAIAKKNLAAQQKQLKAQQKTQNAQLKEQQKMQKAQTKAKQAEGKEYLKNLNTQLQTSPQAKMSASLQPQNVSTTTPAQGVVGQVGYVPAQTQYNLPQVKTRQTTAGQSIPPKKRPGKPIGAMANLTPQQQRRLAKNVTAAEQIGSSEKQARAKELQQAILERQGKVPTNVAPYFGLPNVSRRGLPQREEAAVRRKELRNQRAAKRQQELADLREELGWDI